MFKMNIYLLYPFFVCTLPIHTFYAQNIAEIPSRHYIKALLTYICIITLGYGGLFLLSKNATLSALLFTFNFFAIMKGNMLFINIYSKYKRTLILYKIRFIFMYLLICSCTSFLIYLSEKFMNLNFLNALLFYISTFFTFFIIIDLLEKNVENKKSITKHKIQIRKKSQNITDEKKKITYPDIYHIILDAHSGFAVDEYCDHRFKSALKERGFHIYADHMSNYKITHLSMPSMFNLDYIDNFITDTDKYGFSTAWPFYANSIVINTFRKKGFNFNFITNKGLEPMFCDALEQGDYQHKNKEYNSLLSFLQFNSLIAVFKKTKSSHSATNDLLRPINAFNNLKVKENSQYNLLHLLAPHYPYFFDENGKRINPSNYLNDAYYFTYLKYINKKTIKMIDNIKKKMKPNSLIILHSDHGLHTTPIKPYNILSAAYFPNKEDYSCLPEKTTLVNIFRCIMNKYFDGHYELLENKFYNHNPRSFEIEEIQEDFLNP